MKKAAFFIFTLSFFALAASPEGGSDPYRLLGALPGHSPKELERAFRRTQLRIHPNRNGGSKEAKERFKELQSAYNNLKDPDFRTRYHIYLRESEQNLPQEPNLYKILGVLSDSSRAELTRSYKEIRGRIHPDRHENSPLANERLKELKTAHETLLNPGLRARHDRILRGAGEALTQVVGENKRETYTRETPEEKPRPADFEEGFADPSAVPLNFNPEPMEDTVQAEAWYEQVFDLAKELEMSGGKEDREEAIMWYRFLAQQKNHPEATRRLAPLLEKVDMKEALYRYKQAEEVNSDPDFTRTAVFRQAQIYHTGFSEDGREIVPQDPEKAEELYLRAFLLGVPRREIAVQYDRRGDYEKAEEWLNGPVVSNNGLKNSENRHGNGRPGPAGESGTALPTSASHSLPENSSLLHAGISGASEKETKHSLREETAFKMVKSVLSQAKGDINTADHLGQTPLYLAAKNLYPSVIKLLLRNGANPNIPDQNGVFPIHSALHSFAEAGGDRFLQSQAAEALFLLTDEKNLQIRSGPLQQTPFEAAVDLSLWPLAALFGPPYYLTNEERLRISHRAVAEGREEILELVNNPSKFTPRKSALFQREQIEEMLERGNISEQRKAVSAFKNKPAPLTPEEQEGLVALARGGAHFSIQISALEVLKQRPPTAEAAQRNLLKQARTLINGGGTALESWQIRALLHDIISNLRRLKTKAGVQKQLAELAVSENPLNTSLPQAALKALDRIPIYSKAAVETLIAGLSANLSPKMREGITESLTSFNFAEEDFSPVKTEPASKAQPLAHWTVKKIQKLSWTERAVSLAPLTVPLMGAGLLGQSVFFDGYFISALLGFTALTAGGVGGSVISFEIKDHLERKRQKKAELCKNAFE